MLITNLTKSLAFLGLAALVLAAAPAFAQNPFADQAPLTAADIPAIIEILETARANPTDQAAVMAVYTKHNLDAMRGAYLTLRTGAGVSMLMANMTREQAAQQMGGVDNVPSDAEIAVIKDNLPALQAAMGMPAQ
ncbi:MAG: hypothetical protein LBR80_18320 [Deltaproteobacteria bacterium]|jgi:hypothetical protein|nr:hypothetical protein [Deltaproteobacteria bacterium]